MHLADTLKENRNVDSLERLLSLGTGAALALVFARRAHGRAAKTLLSAASGALLVRGATGYCPTYRALETDSHGARVALRRALLAPPAVHVSKTVTVRRPADEVYAFCANPQNLLLALRSVDHIERLADGYQRWHLRVPPGLSVSCDLEFTEDVENTNLVSWRSRPSSTLGVQGFLSVKRGHDDGESEVRASVSYEPPLGLLGHLAARAASPFTDQLLVEGLRRLKRILEARELPVAESEPASRSEPCATGATPEPEAPRPVDEDIEHRFRQATDADGRMLH